MTHLSAQCQKLHHQDTQYKQIHSKGVYYPFDILYVNILKMLFDNSTYGPQITNTQTTV